MSLFLTFLRELLLAIRGCFNELVPFRFLETSGGSLKELLRFTGDVVNFVILFRVDFNIAEAVALLGDDEEGGEDLLSAIKVQKRMY